jgi:cytochrome c-type biogenesis protein CcmH/NrfG
MRRLTTLHTPKPTVLAIICVAMKHLHSGVLTLAVTFFVGCSHLPSTIPQSAATAPSTNTLTARDNSAPVESGNGLFVADAVTDSKSPADLARFSNGCGQFLQFYAGGQPELGKTPALGTRTRVAGELVHKLYLVASDADQISAVTGATHAAIGKLEGSGDHLKLSYSVIHLPDGAPAGPALTSEGSMARIAEELPSLASKIAAQLGVKNPRVPEKMTLSDKDLVALGTLPFPFIPSLGSKDPVAFLRSLSSGYHSGRQYAMDCAAAFKTGSWNPLLWQSVSTNYLRSLLARENELVVMADKLPNNEQIQIAAARIRYFDRQAGDGVRYARLAVQDNPGDPNALVVLDKALNAEADSVRHGRSIQALSPSELEFCEKRYREDIEVLEKAVVLDPRMFAAISGLQWAYLQGGMHEQALAQLDRMEEFPEERLTWTYEKLTALLSRWGGSEEDFQDFAESALKDPKLNGWDALSVAQYFDEYDYKILAIRFRKKELHRLLTEKAKGPAKFDEDDLLGKIYLGLGQLEPAMLSFRSYIRKHPEEVLQKASFGDDLLAHGHLTQAIEILKEAHEQDPANAEGEYSLAKALAKNKQAKESVQAYERAESLDAIPYDDAFSYALEVMSAGANEAASKIFLHLAEKYHVVDAAENATYGANLTRDPDLVISTSKAVLKAIGPNREAYMKLIWGLQAKGQFKECLAYEQEALKVGPNNPWIVGYIGYSYEKVGNTKRAIEIYKSIHSSLPEDKPMMDFISKQLKGLLAKPK